MLLYTSDVLHKSRNPTKAYMLSCYPSPVISRQSGRSETTVQQNDSLSFDLLHGVLPYVLILRCYKG
jgi:hypothetical protein